MLRPSHTSSQSRSPQATHTGGVCRCSIPFVLSFFILSDINPARCSTIGLSSENFNPSKLYR